MAMKLIQLPGKAVTKLGELSQKAVEVATPSDEWLEHHEVVRIAIGAR